MRDIRRKDVHELLDGIVAGGHVGTAREMRKHLSRLFNWALDREIVTENIAHGIKREELKNNEEAGRALTDEELRAVWHGAGKLGYPLGPMFRLLMLTGQRRGDWARASRKEINKDKQWLEVPRARYKGRRYHIVPLVNATWAIVEGLPIWKDGEFLFSSRAGKTPVSGFSEAKIALDKHALTALREARNDPVADFPTIASMISG
jgi:integrase